SSIHALMAAASAKDSFPTQGRSPQPKVVISESERMPGYLNKSQVPPMAARFSTRATRPFFTDFDSSLSRLRWEAMSIPEIPAPMINTSSWGCFLLKGRLGVSRRTVAVALLGKLGRAGSCGSRSTKAVVGATAADGFEERELLRLGETIAVFSLPSIRMVHPLNAKGVVYFSRSVITFNPVGFITGRRK